MPTRYDLPDGRFVNVPDNPDKQYLIRLQNTLAQEYPEFISPYTEPVETTFGGDLAEVAKGIPRGLANTFLSAGEGIANLFDNDNDNAVSNALRNAQQVINESALGPAEGYEERFSTQFGQGLGSFASFLIPGTAVAKLTGLAGKAKNLQGLVNQSVLQGRNPKLTEKLTKSLDDVTKRLNKVQTASALSVAMPVGISEQGRRIEQAEALGEDVGAGQEILSELLGAGVGATEIFAPTFLLRKITKAGATQLNVLDRIKSAMATGTVEGLQEGLAEILQDAIAAGVYSDELPVGESVFDSIVTGGAVGAFADLVLRGFAGPARIGQSFDLEQETLSRKKADELRAKQKAEQQAIYDNNVPFVEDEVVIAASQRGDGSLGPLIKSEPIPESDATTSQREELPFLENVEVVNNEDGSSSVVGMVSGTEYSNHFIPIESFDRNGNLIQTNPDVLGAMEEASKNALVVADELRTKFIQDTGSQISDIVGMKDNPTLQRLTQNLYDPLANQVDARKVAVMESTNSKARQEQLARIDEIENLEKVLNAQMIRDLTGEGTLDENKIKELEKLIALNRPAYPLDAIPPKYPNGRKKTKAQLKKELTAEFGSERAKDLMERYDNGDIVSPIQEAMKETQGSLLEDLYKIADAKGIERKGYYTIPEVKKLLKPKDFNQALSDRANVIYRLDEQLGNIKAIGRNKDKIDVSPEAFEEILAAKNIDGNITSPEFDFINSQLSGEAKFSRMNRGQKELLMTRIQGLPRFNTLTKIPDLKPRQYTAQQLNAFYQGYVNGKITDKEIQAFFKSQNLTNTKTQRDKFKNDLLNSGRATKVGNRVQGNPLFLQQQEQRQFDEANQPAEVEVLALDPPITNKTYDSLYEDFRNRLNELGLSDLGLRFTDQMRQIRNAVRDDNGNIVALKTLKDAKGKPFTPEAETDKAMQEIVFYMGTIDPNRTYDRKNFEEQIQGTFSHEVYHGLRVLDLITQKEHESLIKEAKAKLPDNVLEELYKNYVEEGVLAEDSAMLQEEMVAELLRLHTTNPEVLNKPTRTIFQKILDFFREFIGATFNSDFRSPVKILEDINSGVIGARERNVIRSRRDTDAFGDRLLSSELRAEDAQKVVSEDDASNSDAIRRTNNLSSYLPDPAYRLKPTLDIDTLLGESDAQVAVINLARDKGVINITAEDLQNLYNEVKTTSTQTPPPFKDMRQLANEVKEAIRLGVDADWYQRWSLQLPALIGDANITEFSGVFGVTSEQGTPEQNFKDTLRTMIEARKIDPVANPKEFKNALLENGVGKKNPQRIDKLVKFYQDGLFERIGTGQKTATYAQTIKELAQGRFSPFTVIDRHMIRNLGLVRPNLKNEPTSASDLDYQIGEAQMQLLADRTYRVDGKDYIFPSAHQIQALLWGYQRYKTNVPNEGSFQESALQSKTEVNEMKAMMQNGQWQMDTPLKDYFIYSPTFTNQTGTNTTGNISVLQEAALNAATFITFEHMVGRDRGYAPVGKIISQDARNQLYKDMMQATTVGQSNRFLRTLGIPHRLGVSAGTYEGELNLNTQIALPNQPPVIVEAVSKVMGDAFLQDSVIVTQPKARGYQKTGVYLERRDGKPFKAQELRDIFNRVQERDNTKNFTYMTHQNANGVTFIDDASFYKPNYNRNDLDTFAEFFREVFPTQETEYNLNLYGQEGRYYEHKSGDYRGAIQTLADASFAGDASFVQRAAISSLYLPIYRVYEKFAEEQGITPPPTKPFEEGNSSVITDTKGIIEAQAKADAEVANASPTAIPRINNNASGFAIKVAFDFEEGGNDNYLDIPAFKIADAPVPKKYEKLVEKVNGPARTTKSYGDVALDLLNDNTPVRRWLTTLRAGIVDKNAVQELSVRMGITKNEALRTLEADAATGAIQALRWVDKAKGIFASMLKHGFVTLDKGLTSVQKDSKLNLINIFAPLYQKSENDNVNYEELAKLYFIARRGEKLNEKGKPIPLTEAEIEQGLQIGEDYLFIKEVFDNFQEYNNKTIDFAVDSGILSNEPNIKEITDALKKAGIESTKGKTPEEILELARNYNERVKPENRIELRSTAQIWKDDSVYYPFYRKMADDSIQGPNIAGGMMTGNPLNVKLKGSEEAVDVPFLEAIYRNQLSIVTAGSKNDALQKLLRNFVLSGRAIEIDAKDASGMDVLSAYVNGRRRFFRVDDAFYLKGLENLGMVDDAGIVKALAFPATVLRETVTRDPGFVLVNMLRDTLSATVTSGAGITPVVDTFKNFKVFGKEDLSDLETFGVLGGYDYSADGVSVVNYTKRILREEGIINNGSLNPIDATVRLWDYLGRKTYESDGATRKAVYLKVLEETGSQAEAAYQAAEIINFSRRGSNPFFRLVTTAIPFLNARIQGLDVLYRSMTGKYSAAKPGATFTSPMTKLSDNTPDAQLQRDVIAGFITRGGMLMLITAMYYALVSDEPEYRARRREERDDNWMIFTGSDLPPLKIPVPFEVGVLFKTLPERLMDTITGRGSLEDLGESTQRAITNTFGVDPLGFQAIKPLYEAYVDNQSGFTRSPIVPQYMEEGLEDFQQYRENTNQLAIAIGRAFNMSPIKLEYVLNGYGGTLGGYLLSLIDGTLRLATGKDIIPPRIDQLPLLKRVLGSEIGGGLQQDFYELRQESAKVVATLNRLKERGLYDEYEAYRKNNEGLIRTRPQVLALNRYMTKWRDRRDKVYRNETISPQLKKQMLEQLEMERNLRLSKVPELRREAGTYINYN